MNTKEKKEKINLLLELRCLYNNSGKPNYARIITDCINDLENNNKYEQIVEDIKQYIIDRKTIEEDIATKICFTYGKEIIDLINWLKRKNFPKPKTPIKKAKLDKAIKEIRDMRIADEKEENERKYDKWFRNLSDRRQAFIAYNFWDNASYGEKKEEYELE